MSHESDRRVARIRLEHPSTGNAISPEIILELRDQVSRIDQSAVVVVMSGQGRSFCEGMDPEWISTTLEATREQSRAFMHDIAELLSVLDALPMPLIAKVQGSAIGPGASLVTIADLTVAATDAMFAFGEVRSGVVPAVVSPYLVNKVGSAFATAVLLTAERFDARRAYEAGLVHKIVVPAELDAAVAGVIDAVLAGGPLALRATKRLVRQVTGHLPREMQDLVLDTSADARAGSEGREGLRAMIERRPPRWMD